MKDYNKKDINREMLIDREVLEELIVISVTIAIIVVVIVTILRASLIF